ncbi:DUF1351 domain-containing protein [Streptococcus uberis]|uniref:DUF1351 domain-containing protein n=1 Tax=Streptococcus uberis TaxID=1349 RepID=UPI0038D47DBD
MQELQAKVTQAQVEIIDRDKFEQGISDVVAKYENYTVTAATIKDDKQVLADLRKLKKQISDERIKIKRELSQSADEFDKYIKDTSEPMDKVIDKIAQDVKEFEEHQKAVRLDTVKSYLANKAAEYMLDARLFDEKALEYVKGGSFMSDGMSLKKTTMKALDDMVTFEFQKQQEYEKAKATISGQCAEYGMNDQPYIRMLKDLTVLEVLGQVKSDYLFDLEKKKLEDDERKRQESSEREQLAQSIQNQQPVILEQVQNQEVDQIHYETPIELTEPKNSLKTYTQKMTLEVYFGSTEEKDFFKSTLDSVGFEYMKNYIVKGYQKIEPLNQEELIRYFN